MGSLSGVTGPRHASVRTGVHVYAAADRAHAAYWQSQPAYSSPFEARRIRRACCLSMNVISAIGLHFHAFEEVDVRRRCPCDPSRTWPGEHETIAGVGMRPMVVTLPIFGRVGLFVGAPQNVSCFRSVFYDARQHPAHVRSSSFPLPRYRVPLHLDRVGDVEPFDGTVGVQQDRFTQPSPSRLVRRSARAATEDAGSSIHRGDGFVPDDVAGTDAGRESLAATAGIVGIARISVPASARAWSRALSGMRDRLQLAWLLRTIPWSPEVTTPLIGSSCTRAIHRCG